MHLLCCEDTSLPCVMNTDSGGCKAQHQLDEVVCRQQVFICGGTKRIVVEEAYKLRTWR